MLEGIKRCVTGIIRIANLTVLCLQRAISFRDFAFGWLTGSPQRPRLPISTWTCQDRVPTHADFAGAANKHRNPSNLWFGGWRLGGDVHSSMTTRGSNPQTVPKHQLGVARKQSLATSSAKINTPHSKMVSTARTPLPKKDRTNYP